MSIITHFNEGKTIHLKVSEAQVFLKNEDKIYELMPVSGKSEIEFKCISCGLEDICSENEILSNKMPCHSVNREDGEDGFFEYCGSCKFCPQFPDINEAIEN